MATPSSGSDSQMISQAIGLNRNLAELTTIIRSSFSPMSVACGSFTCAASTSTTVAAPAIKSGSVVILSPTNQAAATLMAGSNSLFISAKTVGASFAVSGAGAAAGTETFDFIVVNTG